MLHSLEVSAASVRLLGWTPELLHGAHKAYLHITLVVGPGGSAVDANRLPARVADESDRAWEAALPQPLLLEGQVQLFA